MRDVKAGMEQLDRGEYAEYGEDSREQFLADIEAEEQALSALGKSSMRRFGRKHIGTPRFGDVQRHAK
jgi:hypothetical protein